MDNDNFYNIEIEKRERKSVVGFRLTTLIITIVFVLI